MTAAPDPGDNSIEWVSVEAPLGLVHAGAGPTVVFVHGFTQTSTAWRPIAEHFVRQGYHAVLVDLPGHGRSSGVRADLTTTAALLGDSVGMVADRATFVGYSLGGRVCLHLVVDRPAVVERLVTIGAHGGIDDEAERTARREADERLAQRLSEVGVEAFLHEWVALPLFGSLRPTTTDLADRARNTAEGLASSLRLVGTGTQVPLWDRLGDVEVPVLAMAGGDDTKFAALAQRLASTVRRGQWQLVDGAAHAAHLEQPALVSTAIADFINTAHTDAS